MNFIDKALTEAHKALDKHGPKIQQGVEKAKEEATKAAQKHGPKISEGLDKAAQKANEKTGGKHADKIDKAKGKVVDGLHKLENSTPATPASPVDPDAPGAERPLQ